MQNYTLFLRNQVVEFIFIKGRCLNILNVTPKTKPSPLSSCL